MKRSLAREQAFMLVFEKAFRDETVDDIIDQATEGRNVEIDAFAHDLAAKTFASMAELDETIQKYCTKWNLSRLPKVTLSILRLALCEMQTMSDIPVSVTINEAVEIAKRYATEEDASFINGVLGAYARDHAKEEERS